MGAERLPMRKIREVLRLRYEKELSQRAVAAACGMGSGTVAEYLSRAEQAGLRWPLPPELDDSALEARLFPSPPPGGGRVPPDLTWVHQELKKAGVTLLLLWEEYRRPHVDAGHVEAAYGYSQFCDIYRRWERKLKPSMRQVHKAGEKTFIDFSGKKPHIVDPATGEVITVELFVAALGASSYTYAEATRTQQLHDWTAAHVRMLDYFEGCTEIWVPDQLRSAVTRPCRYEPGVNHSYQELARHYGAVVIPARPGKAKDKARVESMVLVAQRWILARLRNRTFFSLEDLNAAIAELLDDLNGRKMQKIGKSRRELWQQIDRPALRALPATRYEQAEWKVCRVNIDYHIEVDRHVYSVPYQLLGEQMEVRFTRTVVEVYYKGRRLLSHRRRYDGQPSTVAEHMPSAHRAHAEWTPSRLIHWAEKTGPATGRVVAGILKSRPHPEQGYRACLGLMRLGKRYGADRLEAACERAEYLRAFSYTTVKNILASSQDRIAVDKDVPAKQATHNHDNIRGGSYYAASKEHEC
jgi:transposase